MSVHLVDILMFKINTFGILKHKLRSDGQTTYDITHTSTQTPITYCV